MTGYMPVDRVPYMPEYWYLPPGLADLECEHGELHECAKCLKKLEADRDSE